MQGSKVLSARVIGCAQNVSRELGAGFLEAVYESALALEFKLDDIKFCRQYELDVRYRNTIVGQYRADFVIENRLIIEVKALLALNSKHESQMMNYLRASGLTVGLLINFGTPRLGIRRMVWNYDEKNKI
jgi:GxxExxY protein